MQALSSLSQNTGGIVNKAVHAGNADPEKYMKRWDRNVRETKYPANYQIQMSPHDIAALINHVRPNLRGKRMLCIGVETFGAERFIAEELGITSVDVVRFSPEAEANIRQLVGLGFSVRNMQENDSSYDLITIFGDNEFNLSAILQYSHVGTQVACLGTSTRNDSPDLRRCWYELRRLHTPILQTVDNYDMGVGVVKIIFKEEPNGQSKQPLYARKSNANLRQHGEQENNGQQSAQTENGIGQESAGNTGRAKEEAGRESLDSPPIREGGQEDLQWSEEQKEKMTAPYGRKLDGTPMKRRGRQAVA